VAPAGVASPSGELAEERQAEAQQHSPWELFPPGGAQAAADAECPRLEPQLAQRMQAAVQARRRPFAAAPLAVVPLAAGLCHV
jgi:hypothetical protein